MTIHQMIPLVGTCISTVFVVTVVISRFVSWIKLKLIDHKKLKEKEIEAKEKELFIALSKKYGGSK